MPVVRFAIPAEAVRDAGAQFDLNFNVLHRFPMMLSAGYARGFGEGGESGDEWMLSLKVL